MSEAPTPEAPTSPVLAAARGLVEISREASIQAVFRAAQQAALTAEATVSEMICAAAALLAAALDQEPAADRPLLLQAHNMMAINALTRLQDEAQRNMAVYPQAGHG
jgi:hypothetical protein